MLDALAIFAVGIVGGLAPLYLRWSDRQHHSALAFSTGIFLGAVFLHVLPVVGQGLDHHAGHVHGSIGPWLWVLVGVLGVFLVEALLIPGSGHSHDHGDNDEQHHAAVGWAALVGLGVHALTAGVGLAAVQGEDSIAGVMLLAILAHKGFESFSLISVFSMTDIPRPRLLLLLVLFSCISPVGILVGGRITDLLGPHGISIITSLAAGTFLYVCLCELLPEVFHRRQDGPLKVALLGVGVAVMWCVHARGGI